MLRTLFKYEDPSLQKEVFGIKFPNPIGIAAGFDKNAHLVDPLSDIGFGFVEIGTVTPKPQLGNPKPRLFRLPKDQGLINRMGFNNLGVLAAVACLKKTKSNVIIGGNIGKNKNTPNDQATDDYLTCFEALYPWVDYFVVNVSSPNTPGLRELQEKEPLMKLLSNLQACNHRKEKAKPILLKIAPDLSNAQLDDIISIVQQTKIAGVVATNTTIAREDLKTSPEQVQQFGHGGVSGGPLTERATEVIRYLHQQDRSIPIIGVGGIFSPQDALDKLAAGASLVQVYTGFIYEGPAMVKRMNKYLAKAGPKSN